LQAQTEQTYTESFDSVFQYVSRTQATTGILYERVVPFANLLNFNSNLNASVDTSSYYHFAQAYSELYRAAFNISARLPWSFGNFEEQIKNTAMPGIIDIALLHYNFNIMDSVVGQVKLSFNNNGFLVENTAITNSLYLQETAFVAAPLSVTAYGTTAIAFRFNDYFNFDNTGASITLLQVDFGDGQGLRTVAMDSNILISYYYSGQKVLRCIASYDNGDTFTSYSIINYSDIPMYVAGNTSGWEYQDDTITAKISYTNYYSGQVPSGSAKGYIRTYYAHSDMILRKPVLIVDGFDPGNKRRFDPYVEKGKIIDGIWDILSYKDNSNINRHFGDSLLKIGYDLVLLDLPDGGGYIERNAMVCIEVINELNRRLVLSDSYEGMVVVGPSMGGQITRYALAYMEKHPNANTNYGKHNCRLWISFDSPHQGANISYGAQAFLHFFGYTANIEMVKKIYENTANCVAARQMLKKHYDNSANAVFNTYYQNLNTLGYPNNLRKIAISNGSFNGTKNGNGCDLVLDMRATLNIKLAKIRLWPDNGSCQIFKGTFPEFFPDWMTIYQSITHTINVSADPGQCSIDAAPGGMYNSFKQIEDAIKAMPNSPVKKITVSNENHCFMPVPSTLDIAGNINYCTNISNRNLVAENLTPFQSYKGSDNGNMKHVSFNDGIVNYLTNEIETYIQGTDTIIGLCGETFNYTLHLPADKISTATVTWTCDTNKLQIISGQGTQNIVVRPIDKGSTWIEATASNLTYNKKVKRSIHVKDDNVYDVITASTLNSGGVVQWYTPKLLINPIVVDNGTTLIIYTVTVKCNPNAKIIVKPSGRVILNGATLTNTCGEMWQGIELQNSETGQAAILEMNNALIENAICAVKFVSDSTKTSSRESTLTATASTFKNNCIAIDVEKKTATYTTVASTFNACSFIIDTNYRGCDS
jgi:hypothetical protein